MTPVRSKTSASSAVSRLRSCVGETSLWKITNAARWSSGSSSHADRLATIREPWHRTQVVVDTHTADGLKVGRALRRADETMIVLETAQPAKFAQTIREALGREPDRPPGFEGIEALPKRYTELAADVQAVKQYLQQHA